VTGDLIALVEGGVARFVLRHHAMFRINRQAADGRQITVSSQFIELVEQLGIAYDVMAVGPARCARKTLNAVS
jgi:hypothetical protein